MRVDRRPAQAERPQQRSQEPPRAPDPEDPAGSVATGINPSFMIHFTSVPSVGAVDHPSSVGRPLPIPFKKEKILQDRSQQLRLDRLPSSRAFVTLIASFQTIPNPSSAVVNGETILQDRSLELPSIAGG